MSGHTPRQAKQSRGWKIRGVGARHAVPISPNDNRSDSHPLRAARVTQRSSHGCDIPKPASCEDLATPQNRAANASERSHPAASKTEPRMEIRGRGTACRAPQPHRNRTDSHPLRAARVTQRSSHGCDIPKPASREDHATPQNRAANASERPHPAASKTEPRMEIRGSGTACRGPADWK